MAFFLTFNAVFAYVGTYSRYWADDYCYSAWVKQLGLTAGIIDWYHTSGNRLSTLVVVAFNDLFGLQSIRFVPMAVQILLLAGWMFFLYQLVQLMRWKVSWLGLGWLSLVNVYFLILLAPDRMQSFYWRMGSFHYTLPLALLLINLGILLVGLREDSRPPLGMILLSSLIAFFAAGLSETFAALQVGLYGIGLAGAVLFLRGERAAQTILLLMAPLFSTLLMLGIMAAAPANAWRQEVMSPPDNLLLVVPFSMRYAFDFIYYSIRDRYVPYGVYWLGIAAWAALYFPVKLSGRHHLIWIGGIGISLLGMYALVVFSFGPSAYAGLLFPGGRAQMPAAFALLTGLGASALFFVLLIRNYLPQKFRSLIVPAVLVFLLLFSLYPVRVLSESRRDYEQLSVRSARWDVRSSQILSMSREGSLHLQVQQVDVVQGLDDLGPDPHFWVNVCAAMFYEVGTITAQP